MALTFFDFWLVYPKRKGSNPKAAARTKWDAAIKSGTNPEVIVNAAHAYRAEVMAENHLGTEFVCHARTWLNQKRYLDYEPDPGSKERIAKMDSDMAKRGYSWDGERWHKTDLEPVASVMEHPREF
jgi:hypothetical protein